MGGRGANSSITKISGIEINIKKYGAKELFKMVYEKKGTNNLQLSNDINLFITPTTGMYLAKNGKVILTNKKEIEKYLDKNKLKVRL